MKTTCIIVDDEPPARELITSYLGRLDDFEITKQFGNAIDVFTYLQSNKVDLMFLDIQMPNMNGLELIKTLSRPPGIVLTTAYRDYAIEGFELDVLDYLVKPITFERFMKAIAKYHQYFLRPLAGEKQNDPYDDAYLFIKVDKDQVKVYLRNILYIECIKDYLKVVTPEKTYITYHRLSNMEKKLPEEHFARIHKSYIVSLDKLSSFSSESAKIAGMELPIGRVYKKTFWETFQRKQKGGSL